MKTFAKIAEEIAPLINEMMPWDVDDYLRAHPDALIVDIREVHEYDTMHIADSLHVPRGILETIGFGLPLRQPYGSSCLHPSADGV